MTSRPQKQVPAVYHRRVGDIVVTTISDGVLTGTLDVLRNITPEEATRLMTDAFRPPPRRTAVNTFLVHSAGRVALIDTGSGSYMGADVGKMPEHLAAVGVAQRDIDTVLLTHMHPDHSCGLVRDGEVAFPNAELVVGAADVAHWHDDAAMARATERERALYFQAAREQVAPYGNRRRDAKPGTEVFPGVTAMSFPGHTPGHTGYLIASGGETLLIWGDIVHVPDIQVPRPEVCMAFDADADAAATRRRVFDMVATDRLLFGGMHLHFPGFARLVRRDDGYVLLPEAWQQNLTAE